MLTVTRLNTQTDFEPLLGLAWLGTLSKFAAQTAAKNVAQSVSFQCQDDTAVRGVLIGCKAYERPNNVLRVTNLKVANDYRHRGAGRALLECFTAEADALSLACDLFVERDNRYALDLYKQFNFRVINEPSNRHTRFIQLQRPLNLA